MMSLDRLAAFTAAALLIIVVPGPSVLFVVGRALAHGRRTALLSVVGNTIGLFAVALLVAAGLGAVLTRSTALFTALKLIGAGYLVWLGVQAIRRRRHWALPTGTDGLVPGGLGPGPAGTGGPALGAPDGWRAGRQGFVVGITNPKVYVLLAAVLPQFVDPAAGHPTEQMLLFTLICCCLALISDGTWAVAASTARTWLGRSPRRLAWLGGAGGTAMIGLGVVLAAESRPTSR